MEYYQIPFSPLDLFKKGEIKKYPEVINSIGDNITLILTTAFGEYAYDSTFGCSIWEHDFENVFSNDQWKDKLAQSIKKSVIQHEPRLINVAIKTNIVQDDVKQEYKNTIINRVKRRIEVIVSGNIITTNEPFLGTQQLYISPISLD